MVTGNSPGHGPRVTQFSLWNEKPPNRYLARHLHEFCVVCRGGIWKGAIFVADAEELKNVDASEVHSRRLNTEEVLTPKKRAEFVFLSQMDQSSWPEETKVFRTSTSIQEHPARGEEHNDVLQGESDGSQPSVPNEGSFPLPLNRTLDVLLRNRLDDDDKHYTLRHTAAQHGTFSACAFLFFFCLKL